MRNILANSFSLNMFGGNVGIPQGDPVFPEFPVMTISVKEVTPEEVPNDCVSVIGHADTAAVVGGILGREVQANRTTYTVEPGDTLYVAQYSGPRLPEGATTLPEGAIVKFYRIERAVLMSDYVTNSSWNECKPF